MEIKLTVNGVDFARYARSGGISIYPILRNKRSIVTIDGTLRESAVEKRGITFEAIELRDATLARLEAALKPRLAAVLYTDSAGVEHEGRFYVTETAPRASTVKGGTTCYDGFGFEAEEK